MQKVHFISLGCVRNLVDSEVMLTLLLQNGYVLTPVLKEADFIVVNTCGFLATARKEAFDIFKRVFANKKKQAKVIAAGCMVEKFNLELKTAFPQIFFYLGAGNVEEIIKAVKSLEQGEIISEKSYLNKPDLIRTLATLPHYAYLKVSEGCSKRCAYCLIPSIKGPLKSRKIEEVKLEFSALLQKGVFEIVLIAQDLGDYGKDLYGKSSLKELIKELLKTKGRFWLRLLYLYPDEIDDELVELMRTDKRIVPYLDMPIQHISNKILKLMKRTTTKEQILKTLKDLKKKIPQIAIRTSLITGFPGEGEAEFQELLELVETGLIDHMGFFPFSKEKGTVAYDLPDQVAEEVKIKRAGILAQAQLKKVEAKNRKYIGKTLEVLIEDYHPDSKNLLKGRFAGQAPEVDPVVIINDFAKVDAFGKMYNVEITAFAGYDLIGRVVSKP